MAAKYLYSLDNSQPMTVDIVTGDAVANGDLLIISSGLVVPATAAATTIIGFAVGAAASGAVARVQLLNEKSVIRVPYLAGTKTSLVAADRFGTAFDWDASSKKLNLDDTTGGFLKVVNYDNTADTADVVIDASAMWNA